jgi:hypothetical protein
MRFAHACLGIAIALLGGAAASAAPDDTPAANSGAPPSAASAATDATASRPQDPRDARDQRRQPNGAAAAAPAAPNAEHTPARAAGAAAASATLQLPVEPKKVCRNMDVVGSKIPRRVCATPEEWAAFENRAQEDAKDGLRRLRNQGAVAPPSPGVSPSALPPTH